MTQRSITQSPAQQDPAPGLRVQLANHLLDRIPEISEDIPSPALPNEGCLAFGRRLQLGSTPEWAITAMAFALLPRPAVWWGHECLKALPDLLTEHDTAMLVLCAAWVAEPDEPHRYAALNSGMQAKQRGAGAWLAIGAGWSGGSMAPQGLPLVEAPPFALGRAVNAAVLTALARVPQDRRARMLDHYLNMGEVLAKTA